MSLTSTRVHVLLLGLAALALSACADSSGPSVQSTEATNASNAKPVASGELETAIFAAGCFWCVEEAFDKLPGVMETTSGYTGGHVEDPNYKQVTRGGTGHLEALRVRYNPGVVTYDRLLEHFWHNVDPFDPRGQFCDKGESYTSAIFAVDSEQRAQAEASRKAVKQELNSSQPIATKILDASTFYPAEDYHQDYHQKNALRYKFYKSACGRVDRLEEIWGDDNAVGPRP